MVDGSSICSKVSFLKVDIDNGYERHSSSANPASAGEIGAGKPKEVWEGKYSARIPNGKGLWLLGCPVGSGWIKGARISG